jgi:hypothetical protein
VVILRSTAGVIVDLGSRSNAKSEKRVPAVVMKMCDEGDQFGANTFEKKKPFAYVYLTIQSLSFE